MLIVAKCHCGFDESWEDGSYYDLGRAVLDHLNKHTSTGHNIEVYLAEEEKEDEGAGLLRACIAERDKRTGESS